MHLCRIAHTADRNSRNRPDCMQFQFNQFRSGQRLMSKKKRQCPASGRCLEPVKCPVFIAQVCRVRPAADDLSRIIEAAQQALVVEVEDLLTGVSWNIRREGHLQPGKFSEGSLQWFKRLDKKAFAAKHEGRGQIVPVGIACKVDEIQIVPEKLPADAAECSAGVLLCATTLPQLSRMRTSSLPISSPV